MSAGDDIARFIKDDRIDLYASPSDEKSPAYYPNEILEERLVSKLAGESFAGLPLRTRSKVAKQLVCAALGYAAPTSFKKTQPRFPSPNFDLYVQKSDNLQIWNQEVDPSRRYVVLGLDYSDTITAARVLSGQELALLDTTGTLTSKYQAKRLVSSAGSKLVKSRDTEQFLRTMLPSDALNKSLHGRLSPVAQPLPGAVLTIAAIYDSLSTLVGTTLADPGITQERLRGVALQRAVCNVLKLGPYADAGQFPDILCQALEVKLQLSPTVDLGLVAPDQLITAPELGHDLRYCDARYAVLYGARVNSTVLRISHIVVSTGLSFFDEFRRFEGNVQNRKLQIRLPNDFFQIVYFEILLGPVVDRECFRYRGIKGKGSI